MEARLRSWLQESMWTSCETWPSSVPSFPPPGIIRNFGIKVSLFLSILACPRFRLYTNIAKKNFTPAENKKGLNKITIFFLRICPNIENIFPGRNGDS